MSGSLTMIERVNELIKQGLSKEEEALQAVLEEKVQNKTQLEQVANALAQPNNIDMIQQQNMGLGLGTGPILNNGINGMHNQHFEQMMFNQTQTNLKAIVSFIIAIVSALLLPIIGQIISIVLGASALREIGYTRERGRGLAIAGVVISIIMLTLIAVIIISLVATMDV